jgi:hypothetical protein
VQTRRLALLLLTAFVAACDAPRPPAPPAAPAPVQAQPALAPLTEKQQTELAVQCERKSGERFRRERPGQAAEYSAHYNRKLNACFYLVTITESRRSRKLIDIGENEVYGEYSGAVDADTPAAQVPNDCRVEAMYCSSEREWNVLVARYMETD